MGYKYNIYQPDLNGNELKYVNDCITSTWISSKGKYVREFETAFAEFIDVKHASSVCNGTVALHLALLSLPINLGDEIIVPAFTYVASVNAIKYIGATPVFVDSNHSDAQLNVDEVRKKITPKTKAILAVHIFGHVCDIEELALIAKNNNLFLIEDCAESFGSKYKDRFTGTFGDVSTFSFFGNKTITTGEGGMVATNDEAIFEKIRKIKNQGVSDSVEYWHDVLGYNFRMTNVTAAIGLAQIERAEKFIIAKREIAYAYQKKLASTPLKFIAEHKDKFDTFWMVTLFARTEKERNDLRKYLDINGIETRPTFHPAYKFPYYNLDLEMSGAEYLANTGFCLPSYPALTNSNLDEICSFIIEFYQNTIK